MVSGLRQQTSAPVIIPESIFLDYLAKKLLSLSQESKSLYL